MKTEDHRTLYLSEIFGLCAYTKTQHVRIVSWGSWNNVAFQKEVKVPYSAADNIRIIDILTLLLSQKPVPVRQVATSARETRR